MRCSSMTVKSSLSKYCAIQIMNCNSFDFLTVSLKVTREYITIKAILNIKIYKQLISGMNISRNLNGCVKKKKWEEFMVNWIYFQASLGDIV